MAEGKRVRLEYDEGTGRNDRYGRTLAYVYLENETLLNLEIIERGFGHAYTRFPFSKMEAFRAAERYARENDRGLWAKGNTEGSRPATRAPPMEATAVSCTPRSECCKVCQKGQACGNSCISASYTCRKGRGCACNAGEICP